MSEREPGIWKIAPGDAAWQWGDCVRDGFIGVGWDELGDISSLTKEGFSAKVEELSPQHGWGEGVWQVWKLARDIQVGDTIVANLGTRAVLGLGRVTGPYTFEPGAEYGHRLSVDWYDTIPRQVDQPSWRKTLVGISQRELAEIQAAQRPPMAEPFNRIFENWEELGWAFGMLREALDAMRCTGPDDRRFALTFPSNGPILRLNAGNWLVLDFRGPGENPECAVALLDKESRLGVSSWGPYKQPRGEPAVKVFYPPKSRLRKMDESLRMAFQRSMEFIGTRIADCNVSSFWKSHNPELFAAIYEPARLSRLALTGLKTGRDSRIPNEITSEHVELAMQEIDEAGIPASREAVNQAILWQSREYPPKYVVSVATRLATGEELDPQEFNTHEAVRLLKRLGFNVVTSTKPAKPEADSTAGTEIPAFSEISRRIRSSGLVIDDRDLRRYHVSLTTRGFVILAGPSGSGKTWLTQAYADAIGAVYLLVPVAPNWTSNEDLLGFFNPVEGKYFHTPFSRFLEEAATAYSEAGQAGNPPPAYHLVLDEMNLARVEYYFAKFLSGMELRSRNRVAEIELAPGVLVELPPNLSFIGTVNVDETTHDFSDKVYDRAQLIELHAPREALERHLAGKEYQTDVLAIWDAVSQVAPFAFRVLDEIASYVEGSGSLGVVWEESLDDQFLQKVLPRIKGADPRLEHALEQIHALCQGRFALTAAKAHLMLENYRRHGFVSYF